MGIVVCIALLFSILLLLPLSVLNPTLTRLFAWFCILAGCWNLLWYTTRHWGSFWAYAALLSGLVLLYAGVSALLGKEKSAAIPPLLSYTVLIAAVLSFLLYFVTIVRLNLGLAIIG